MHSFSPVASSGSVSWVGTQRLRILVMKTFFTESCCCICFLICSEAPGCFPLSESRGSSASLKTPTLPELLLQFPCSFDFCVTQILVLCFFMPSRFLIWTEFSEVIPVQIEVVTEFCILVCSARITRFDQHLDSFFFFNDLIRSWIEKGLRKTNSSSPKAQGPSLSWEVGCLGQSSRMTRFLLFCCVLSLGLLSLLNFPVLLPKSEDLGNRIENNFTGKKWTSETNKGFIIPGLGIVSSSCFARKSGGWCCLPLELLFWQWAVCGEGRNQCHCEPPELMRAHHSAPLVL